MDIKKNTRGRILSFIICFTVAIVGIIVLSLYNYSTASADDKLNISIKEMNNAVNSIIENNPVVAAQSNPYAYAKGNEYYEKIVAAGPEIIPEIEKVLKAENGNGLNEYLLAIAIEEIAKTDIRAIDEEDYAWSVAGEFTEKWAIVKEEAPGRVASLLSDKNISDEQKIVALSNYGLLAIPAVEKYKEKNRVDAALDEMIENHISKIMPSNESRENISKYLK